jgi:hypothetical protein
MKFNKQCLIIYSELNLFDPNRAGGIDHLLANIRGYNDNGYRCITIGSLNWRIIYRDKNNIYLNIFVNISKNKIPLNSISLGLQNYVLNIIKINLKKQIIIVYKNLVKLIVRFFKASIVHERATSKYDFYSLSNSNCKYVYEINDFQYSDLALQNSDLALVTNKEYYPLGPTYYSHPWPVNIHEPQLNSIRKIRKIVYMGSLIGLHSLDLMTTILEELNKYESWEVHVYGPPQKYRIIKNLKYFKYKGYVESEKISPTLSKYMFGFALYSISKDKNRLNVGSPSKTIHYLMNGVVSITNLINDSKLEKICGQNIINLNNHSIEDVVSKILSIHMHYQGLKINTKWIANKYHPNNYYSQMLKMIDR